MLFGIVFGGANVVAIQAAEADEISSVCRGLPASGSLEHGWRLPASGSNYEAYSLLGVAAGRTYVHSRVHAVVVGAYAMLAAEVPHKHFVYGETGFESGGRFHPHKTHQNGLSVDFFVPVINAGGESVTPPISVFNKLGYGIEFDEKAGHDGLSIDFEAMAKHLRAIKRAADREGIGIRVVIFDNAFQEKLMATPTGKTLPSILKFSKKKPWVRRDEHYHVDFTVDCS